MRLPLLRAGQSRLQRALFGIIRRLAGDIPGPILVMSYRKAYFGRRFSRCLQEIMRRCQHWSVAEVELFAAVVSKKNGCAYCLADHTAVALSASADEALVRATVEDYETAPLDERVRITLRFLEKLTLAPESVGPGDIAPLRAAGLADDAIEEAIHVCFLFGIIARLADALDFALPDARRLAFATFLLRHIGYGAACIPG
jgi:uncharacterized peroxidase-related enzyme